MNTYKIVGKPRHYAWGGKTFIPQLFQQNNLEHQNYAEWWLGAHPDNPSTLIDEKGNSYCFLEWLKENHWMQDPRERDPNYPLPFLMKVLDVNEMLAIQVHPTKQQAIEGFARQDEDGIERSAPERTYRDSNAKPEMMVALTSSWLAHGFCDQKTIADRFGRYEFLSSLSERLESEGTYGTFKFLMYASQEELDKLLLPLLELLRATDDKIIAKDAPEYWIKKAYFCDDSGCDRALLTLFLMNIVHVSPGHGIYQDAGIPHAYLSGQNVELMANSDNVVRIGPTKLHVDIPELMRLIRYDVVVPNILKSIEYNDNRGVSHYQHNGSCAFELKKIELTENVSAIDFEADYVSIIMVVDGDVVIQNESENVVYTKGDTFVVPHNTSLQLISKYCTAYVASYGG